MASSVTRTDELFWLAYCDAIRTTAGFSSQDAGNNAIFFGTSVQRGPPAGDKVSSAYTNAGLYAIADNLLKPDSLFYAPSAQNSYIRYMGYVDLKGNPSPEQITNLTSLLELQNSAAVGADRAFDAALPNFNKHVASGMVQAGTLFPQWATLNAPAYTAAKQNLNSAAAQYQTALNTVYGAQASSYNADFARIQAAMYPNNRQNGFTMTASSLSPQSAMQVFNAVLQGTPVPEPTGTYLVADYHSGQYSKTVSDFMGFINNDHAETHSLQIQMNSGSIVKLTDFGITSASGGAGFSYFPWFSVDASGSSSSSASSVLTEQQSQGIQVTMTYKSIRTADIAPGTWNIGDPKNAYQLKANAPASVRTLVRPSRLVIGCGVGWVIRVSDSAASSIDTATSSAQSGGGSLSISGIPISVGGSFSQSTEKTTHNAAWESSSKTLTVKPTFDAGFASVLAVIGEKVQTA